MRSARGVPSICLGFASSACLSAACRTAPVRREAASASRGPAARRLVRLPGCASVSPAARADTLARAPRAEACGCGWAGAPGSRAPGSWPAPRCHAHSCRTTRSSALRPPPAGRGGRLHPEPWQVPEAGAPLRPGPGPTPAWGTPTPPPSSRGEPTRSPGHQAQGQERRANASAACPQPLTGVFQVTEAAHLHPSLIITAWWPGVQAPVWSSHNASGIETS